jgi:hypothetical protein
VDPALRRYLEKEFLGGEVFANLVPAGGETEGTPKQAETAVMQQSAGVWATIKRALFREPRRARWTTVPGRV